MGVWWMVDTTGPTGDTDSKREEGGLAPLREREMLVARRKQKAAAADGAARHVASKEAAADDDITTGEAPRLAKEH